MNILSWNMLYRNEEVERAYTFISESGADIVCLQEVPEAFLHRLTSLPYTTLSATDREMAVEGHPATHYLVILSRYPVREEHSIPLPDYWATFPLRTRLYITIMPPTFAARMKGRTSLIATVDTPHGPLQVMNLHLFLASPAIRKAELEATLKERDPSLPLIVCGDFNIIESGTMAILNWILGGTLQDAYAYPRERREIEHFIATYDLRNPLRGNVTHDLARSQLDHILVSHHFRVENAAVVGDCYGSDHHPITVTLA